MGGTVPSQNRRYQVFSPRGFPALLAPAFDRLPDGVWVPDFRLVHTASGKEVYVELYGYWRRGGVEADIPVEQVVVGDLVVVRPGRFRWEVRPAGRPGAAAAEGAASGIRVNVVVPAVVETPATAGMLADAKSRQGTEKLIPMGRVGQPEEIANAILFLASDEASYVNGAVLEVSGGLTV